MLLPAGKYTLAKDQHMIELAENLEFYAKDGEKEKLFVGLRIEEDYLGFLLANKDGVDRFPNSEQWQEDEEYRTITTTKDQHISERLYYWLVGNRLYVPNRLKLKSRLELPEVPETPEQQKNESLEGGHYSFKSELSTTYTWSSLKGFSEEAINNQIYIEPIAVEGKGTINAITVPCRIYRTVEKLDEETGEYIDFVETDATIVGCYFQEDPEAIQIAYLSGLDNAYAPTEPTESPWLLPVQNITVLNQLVHSNTKERFLAAVSSVEKNRQEGGLVLTWDGMYNNQHNEEFAGFYYTKISDAIYTIEELQEATVHIINTAANPDELNGTYSNIVIVEDSDGYDTLCYETEDGIHFLGVSILRDPSLLFPDVPAGIYFGKNIETGVYPSKLELPNAPQLDIETIEPEVIEVEPVLLFEEYFDFLIEVPSFNLSLPSKGIKVDSSGLYVYDTANEVEQWNDITGAGTEGEVFLVFGEGKVPSAKLQNWLARNCEVFLSPGEYRLKLAPALPSNDIKQDLTLNFNGLLDGLIPMTDLRPGITINQSGIFLGAPETTEGDESVSTTDTDTIDALEF